MIRIKRACARRPKMISREIKHAVEVAAVSFKIRNAELPGKKTRRPAECIRQAVVLESNAVDYRMLYSVDMTR